MNNQFVSLILKTALNTLTINNIVNVRIFKATLSSIIGLTGTALFIKENSKNNLIFDFGQTFIKRGIATFDKLNLVKIDELSKVSCNIFKDNDAYELDKNIVKIIIDTYNSIDIDKYRIGKEIVISIASSIVDKKLSKNGFYGKLNAISSMYGEHLTKMLSNKLNSKIIVELIHDGTAIAANFNNNKNSASIAAGTAFGIGFPDSVNSKI